MARRQHLALLLAAALSATCALAQFTDGQSVEVREGDTWSPATILKREGRRYQIRYQGSIDEDWVASDRLRAPGTAGTPAPAAPAPAGNPAPGAVPPLNPSAYTPGQELESKRGPTWRAAKYQKTENGWILVRYTQGNYMEWVEPWRIRPTGSKEDLIGTAPMNKEAKDGDPAPTVPPSEAPGPIGGVAGWREPIAGDRVLYLDGWKVQPAKVVALRSDRVEIQLEEGRSSKIVNAKDVRLAGFKFDAKVNQRVQIREPAGWVSGVVVSREADRVRVMQDGWENEMFHKWKGLDELRPPDADDVPPIAKASADDLRKIPGYKDANAGSARPLTLIVARGSQYAPDVILAAAELPALQLAPIAGAKENYIPKAIVVARSGKFAAVSSHANKDNAIIDRIDLASGDHLSSVQILVPSDMVVRDLSPDGARVLMGAPQGDRLEIWSVDSATPRRQTLMFPYPGNHFEKQVRFAALLPEDRLLTIGGKSEMHLWDTSTGRAIYTCAASPDSRPAVSPTGKYLAFSTGTDAVMIEIATGKAIMDLPPELSRAKSMAFSADGTELVACDSTNIYAVDLTTGTLSQDFALPGRNTLRSIASPAPGFALANESVLIDLKTKAPVWKYKLGVSPVSTTTPSGQVLFTYAGGRATMLVTATVPHASALKQLQKLPQRQMLLSPGAKVSLSVNVSGADQEREKITTYLKNQLTSNGFSVGDNQPLRLVASLERGQAISQEYGSGPSFGPFARPRETVTIAPWVSRLRLEYNGKPVWEVTAANGGPSPILMKRDGQSAQQVAEEQNKPQTGIFTSTRIPAYMVMPENPLHRFESDFTGRLFRDMPAVPDAPQDPNKPQPGREMDASMV